MAGTAKIMLHATAGHRPGRQAADDRSPQV